MFDGVKQRSHGWLRLGRITGNVPAGATRVPVGLSDSSQLACCLAAV